MEPFLNKGMTFASLKEEGTVSVIIDIFTICFTGATVSQSVPSRKKREEMSSKQTAFLGSKEESCFLIK